MRALASMDLALVAGLALGVVACRSAPPVSGAICVRAHANYIEIAKATYQCKAAADCLLTTDDLRRLNHAESEVAALCVTENLP